MSESDLAVYVDAFRAGGFRGPLNRYRAQTLDFADLAELSGRGITQPSAFIAGERDPVRAFIPGVDLYADPGDRLLRFPRLHYHPGYRTLGAAGSARGD